LEEGLPDTQLFPIRITDGHFEDIIHFLTTRIAPQGYSVQQNQELMVCMVDFFVIAGHLYKMGNDEILQRHVPKFECSSILVDAHADDVGGHYRGRETMQNILRTGLWWPTID